MVEARVNDCFIEDDEDNDADIAILVLSSDVTGTVYNIYEAETDGNEVGKEFVLMGWGDYGAI